MTFLPHVLEEGKSVGSINSLLYEGKGGFDLMIAAVISLYDLNSSALQALLDEFQAFIIKEKGNREIDRRWFNLPISEEDRFHWLSVIEVLSKLDYSLQKKAHKRASGTN